MARTRETLSDLRSIFWNCSLGCVDARGQLRQIERGCDLLADFPGRLVDLFEYGRLSMENGKHSFFL